MAGDALDAGEDEEEGAHVGWLLLHPDELARLGVARQLGRQLFLSGPAGSFITIT